MTFPEPDPDGWVPCDSHEDDEGIRTFTFQINGRRYRAKLPDGYVEIDGFDVSVRVNQRGDIYEQEITSLALLDGRRCTVWEVSQ